MEFAIDPLRVEKILPKNYKRILPIILLTKEILMILYVSEYLLIER